MSLVKSGNVTHDTTCSLAEGVQQAAVGAATQDAAGALVVKNANIVYHRAIVASAKANLGAGVGVSASLAALRELGVNA